MAKHTFEIDAKCQACGGTGLYVGRGEGDGAAVVCWRCKGLGHFVHVLNYEDFEGRSTRPEVRRVYRCNPGMCIGEDLDRPLRLEDFGGMPYAEWLDGKPFPAKSEDRNYTCPAWWYQCADSDLKPRWDECIAVDPKGDRGRARGRARDTRACGVFSDCQRFKDRHLCWEKWDAEYGKEKDHEEG